MIRSNRSSVESTVAIGPVMPARGDIRPGSWYRAPVAANDDDTSLSLPAPPGEDGTPELVSQAAQSRYLILVAAGTALVVVLALLGMLP